MMTKQYLKELLLNLQSTNDLWKRLKKLSGTYKIYVCGGYIRNIILNKTENKDIDVFVDCTPKEFSKVIAEMGKWGEMSYGQYGSPRLYVSEPGLEYVDIVPFSNFIVAGRPLYTIEDILQNFDFTANAVAWSFRDDIVLDPLGAIEDISHGTLRAVRLDFPEMMISKDVQISAVSVFWFRLLHYQCKLGFKFDPVTNDWVVRNKFRMKDFELFRKYFFEPSISTTMLRKLQ